MFLFFLLFVDLNIFQFRFDIQKSSVVRSFDTYISDIREVLLRDVNVFCMQAVLLVLSAM